MNIRNTVALVLSFLFLSVTQVFALTNGEQEVLHTRALLDYHSKKYSVAKAKLNKILTANPKSVQALELLALVQKESKEDRQALDTYYKLIAAVAKAKQAPYRFEAGLLEYQLKNYAAAENHLWESAKNGFNPGTSFFFLGLMDFEKQDFKAAMHHFSAALDYKDAEAMKTMSQYYLSLAYSRQGKVDAAVRGYHKTAITVPDVKNDALQKAARDLRRNALNELKSFDHHQWMASVTLLGQWDGNVQTNPSDTYNPLASSMQRSWKNAVNLTMGYATSPVRMFQFMPSYRMYTNYNYNTQARDFNFFTHSAGFYLLYKPYNPISVGIKSDATYTMKNNIPTGASYNKIDFRSFSLVADIGLVGRWAFSPRTMFVIEAVGRPKRYYTDPATGVTRRTGSGSLVKVMYDHVSGNRWWNPNGTVSFEWDNTEGKNYMMHAFGASVGDTVDVINKLTATQSFEYLGTSFFKTTNPQRSDEYFAMRTMFAYSFTSSLSAMTDFMYVINDSTIPSIYKYRRILSSVGLTYTF